jgi:hypothetical protein
MDLPPTRTLTFLDLPEQVRIAIYHLAGLVRLCPVDLLSRRDPRDDDEAQFYRYRKECWHEARCRGVTSSFHPGSRLCHCPALPLALTLVCRRVREEALDVLAGANFFVLRVTDGSVHALQPLLTTIPTSHLSRMRRLLIRLNCWPCPDGHDPTSYSSRPDGSAPTRCHLCRRNFDPNPHFNLHLLDAWGRLCQRLGSGRPTGTTELTVIYDVGASMDDGLARGVVDPLTRFLPPLRSCTIRLGRSPAERGQARVARDTALALMGEQPQSDKPFPFHRLPWELRMRILQHTHLGPPDLAGYDRDYSRVQVVNGRLLKGKRIGVLSRSNVKCCGKCSPTFLDW